ncbi:MAG: carboxypeptidase-like regulatory domain-containing protein [Bacteroidales bacterium]|nr:carboxypeptidase-like regulatory domain-containing protein [Bacteroidales bacterium]
MKPIRNPLSLAWRFLAAFVFVTVAAFGQKQVICGKVTDKQNRQPLAFVNVMVNEGQCGGISDIDGKYEINCPDPIRSLRFSCLGYKTVDTVLADGQHRLNVALQPTTFQLNEVTVEAGENPAHRIIDSVMAHRKDNNPNSLDAYRYHIYDQMVITIDSSFNVFLDTIQKTEKMSYYDSLLKRSDLMIMESYSEVLFRSPDQFRQNVLGTKMSGSKNAQAVYLASKMQSTSFYGETVNIAGTDYVNPVSQNSKSHYFFTLESVSPAWGPDSLYVISFHPFRGSTFNGLRGTMTIHSDGWALQSVKAAPNEQGGIYNISIQQLYQKVEGQWFPKQLNTNLVFPSVVADLDGYSFPMVAIGKSYVSDVELHPVLSNKAFSEVEVEVPEVAAYRDDAFWTQHRIDSLTERILNTYHFMDSLTEGNDIFDRVLGVSSKLMEESSLPLGPVDLNLGSMFRYSALRGFYVGLHLSTNNRFNKLLRLGGFCGYWTRLRDFDYGVEGKLMLYPESQMELGWRYAHKSWAMGEFGGFGEGSSLLSENEYRYTFYENVMARGNVMEWFYTTRFARHFKAFLTYGCSERRYHLQPFDTMPSTHLTMAEVKIRFAYKEKFVGMSNGIKSLGTDYPIVWLSCQRSLKGFLDGEYDFYRFKLQVEKDFQTHYWGKSSLLLQAGYASKGCPVLETFNILGSYEPFGLYSPGCFATMGESEFFCDRFVALFVGHDFQGMLWTPDVSWFQPQLCLVGNFGWGNRRPDGDPSFVNFKTMENGFFEGGIVVKGLLSLPLMKIGAGVFSRFGAYASPRYWDNLAFKWSATFSL